MLEALFELPPEKRNERIDAAWSRILDTEDGQIAVGSLLDELGTFDLIAEGTEGVARHNIAMGILRRIHSNSTRLLIEALVRGKGRT